MWKTILCEFPQFFIKLLSGFPKVIKIGKKTANQFSVCIWEYFFYSVDRSMH